MLEKMNRRGRAQVATTLLLALVAAAGWQVGHPAAGTPASRGPAPMGNSALALSAGVAAPAAQTGSGQITAGQDEHHDLSQPLRDIAPIINKATAPKLANDRAEMIPLPGHKDAKDAAEQTSFAPGVNNGASLNIPATGINFDGVNSAGACNGCAPPDTNGAVGTNDFLQMVNSSFAVYSKAGSLRYGPANINTVWSGFGGVCQTTNDGDPVVVYDRAANRFVISQFAFNSTSTGPFDECIAVSQTSDPTGAWYRYAFVISNTAFDDYPKLGVWPDGYYASFNMFTGGQTYAGPEAVAFERTAMLTGGTARFQTRSPLGSSASPLLPSDFDGTLAPPAGAPNYFVDMNTPMDIYKYHVDWNTPGNSTFTLGSTVSPAAYTQFCGSTGTCVPQPGTSQQLDSLGDRLMFRLSYRRFADGHESLVVNHAAQASGGQGGVRWYEIRNPAGSASIYQQGTYAPDSTNRWMGSVAMDQAGDIGLGYSVSSSSVYPGIRYTGRLVTDALGTMPQGEGTILTGSGYQTTYSRWGDYSDMTVDPSDDCTFWFTTEYNNSHGLSWSTRIASFKFPSCSGAPPPTATNTPPPGPTNTPTNTPPPGPTNTPTATPVAGGCSEKVTNGGFETGALTPWTQSTGTYSVMDTSMPHTGTHNTWFAGYNNANDTLYQNVTIPSTATSATLTYWWKQTTQEACCTAYDYMYVQVLNTSGTLLGTVQTVSNAGTAGTYTKSTYSLLAYKGQTVRLQFRATNDGSLPTNFFVDDVSLNVCQ